MEDHGISLNKHCPCTQVKCRIRGNCVLCVQNHLCRENHIPECMQDMLRDKVEALAKMMQLKTEEGRPKEAFWDTYDTDKQVKGAIARHDDESGDEE